MKDELFYLIISDNKFSNELIKKFPGLYSYITAYRQNASPEHNEKCKNIINKFYDENEHFRKHLLNYIKDNSNEPRVDGKVFEIANDEEYLRLIRKLKTENWKYEGLSVVHLHDKIKVYFY
jgi:uncharacterized membrane protein YheB (UPF0754 family)